MEAFDKDGNPIENAFSQEELDEKLKEATEEQKTEYEKALEEAGTAAVEAFKKENPPQEENSVDKPKENQEEQPPAWFKPFADRVDALSGNQTSQFINPVLEGLDADKQKEVREKFDSLQGYEDTQDGVTRRAEDAYLLVTGERFDGGGINTANLNAMGTGQAPITVSKEDTSVDKPLQDALGISKEDVEKYGSNKKES